MTRKQQDQTTRSNRSNASLMRTRSTIAHTWTHWFPPSVSADLACETATAFRRDRSLRKDNLLSHGLKNMELNKPSEIGGGVTTVCQDFSGGGKKFFQQTSTETPCPRNMR